MSPVYIWASLATVIAILGATVIVLGRIVFKYRHDHKVHLERRNQSMFEDLELATSDQLLAELRKRTAFPYLLLSPIENDDNKGISIEIHNIPPIPCLQMLSFAASMTAIELRKNGVDVPDSFFPSPQEENDDGEEWKQSL